MKIHSPSKIIPRFSLTFFLLSFLTPSLYAAAPKSSPPSVAEANVINYDELVKKADEIRNPSESYVMKIKVSDGNKDSVLEVYLKGKEKTIIVTKEPLRDKGRNMLMLDRDFYVYVPNLKRSLRLSLAQKLSGQVANGDISRTRWHGDYTVTFEKEESGQYVLLLKAQKENLTYHYIRLWLNQSNAAPVKADYLNLSGDKVLKSAYFENYKIFLGKSRPGTIRIEDTAQNKSFIYIETMENKNLTDHFFTTQQMETL